jgi:hypothetical protein
MVHGIHILGASGVFTTTSLQILSTLSQMSVPSWLTDKTQSLPFLGCFLLLKGKTILSQLLLFL